MPGGRSSRRTGLPQTASPGLSSVAGEHSDESPVGRLGAQARKGEEWYRDVPSTEPRMQTLEPLVDTGEPVRGSIGLTLDAAAVWRT
ncbi:MAG: hypothetical protein V3V64_09560, partial [Acidiferrobacterales bacterium]